MAKNSKDTSKAAAAKEETKKTNDEAKKTTTASKTKSETKTGEVKTEEAPKGAVQSTNPTESSEPSSEKENDVKSQDLHSKQKDLSYKEASELMSLGAVIKLPEWEGFWFQDMTTGQTFVLTKDNEILDTPDERFKSRIDWEVSTPNKDQEKLLKEFWAKSQKKFEGQGEKINKDNASKKVVAVNSRPGSSFHKLEKPISLKKLETRESLPAIHTIDSQYLLDSGEIYSFKDNSITNEDGSVYLDSLTK